MDPLQNVTRKKMMILVFGIIVIQIVVSSYFLMYKKAGYFADDMYSYGFANSGGLITPLDTAEGRYNLNAWINGSELNDYLTVSKDETFAYGSIVDVLKTDAHPPLFYFLLHLICSLTPYCFSPWSAFIINIAGLILMQIYLYRLTLLISKNRTIALMTVFFFGLTSATVSMMCFLRMYVLAAGFTLGFSFYAFRYMLSVPEKKLITKDLLLASLMLYLGSMTVYLTVIFAFFLTFFICIILLFEKKIRRSLCFGTAMLISVSLMVLSFPVVIDQLLYDQPALGRAEDYPYMLQLRMGLHIITDALFGFGTPIFPNMLPFYLFWGCIGLLIIYAILFFLFRNDGYMHTFNRKAVSLIKTLLKKASGYVKTLLPVFLSYTIILVIFARKLMLYYYKYSGLRYLYFLTPFISMTVFIILFKLIRSGYARIILLAAITCISLLRGQKSFLQSGFRTAELRSITKDADVIVVENQAIVFMYHIMDLLDCKSFLYTAPFYLVNHIPDEAIEEKTETSNDLILIVDVNAHTMGEYQTKSIDVMTGQEITVPVSENEVVRHFTSDPRYKDAEYLGDFFTCYVYRLK